MSLTIAHCLRRNLSLHDNLLNLALDDSVVTTPCCNDDKIDAICKIRIVLGLERASVECKKMLHNRSGLQMESPKYFATTLLWFSFSFSSSRDVLVAALASSAT